MQWNNSRNLHDIIFHQNSIHNSNEKQNGVHCSHVGKQQATPSLESVIVFSQQFTATNLLIIT